jgi:hypothetical protein
MTKQEHIERHKILHTHLDELLADFMSETGKLPSKSSLMELMEWSYLQTKNPSDRIESECVSE